MQELVDNGLTGTTQLTDVVKELGLNPPIYFDPDRDESKKRDIKRRGDIIGELGWTDQKLNCEQVIEFCAT